jgi:pyruvate decarboxylase
MIKSQPVYIFLPLDIVSQPVDASRLSTPLDLSHIKDDKVEDELVSQIAQAVLSAKKPVILADVFTSRFQCTQEVRQLVEVTQFPVTSFYIGRTNVLSPLVQIWAKVS